MHNEPVNVVVLRHFKGRTNEKSKDVTTLDWNVSLWIIVVTYLPCIFVALSLVSGWVSSYVLHPLAENLISVFVYLCIHLLPQLICSTMLFVMQLDGTLLATGSYDGQARIWTRDGELFDILFYECFLS